MEFDIFITEGGKWYAVHIQLINATKTTEQFIISTKVNTVTVQSNRPLIRAKKLRWKYPFYTIIEGAIRYKSTFEKITHEITLAMELGPPEPPKPKPDPTLDYKLSCLGYDSPRRAKSETDKEYGERKEQHKQQSIKRNKEVLERRIF